MLGTDVITEEIDYKELTETGMRIFLDLFCMDKHMRGSDPDALLIKEEQEKDLTFISKVILKRIQVLKLPIVLEVPALLFTDVLADGNVGKAIFCLIELLNVYEGRTVTLGMMVDLYPDGFHSEKEATRMINELVKTRKMKWSEIY